MTVRMVTHLCECTKNHWIEHFKWVNCMLCELYLNKAVKKKWLLLGRRNWQGPQLVQRRRAQPLISIFSVLLLHSLPLCGWAFSVHRREVLPWGLLYIPSSPKPPCPDNGNLCNPVSSPWDGACLPSVGLCQGNRTPWSFSQAHPSARLWGMSSSHPQRKWVYFQVFEPEPTYNEHLPCATDTVNCFHLLNPFSSVLYSARKQVLTKDNTHRVHSGWMRNVASRPPPVQATTGFPTQGRKRPPEVGTPATESGCQRACFWFTKTQGSEFLPVRELLQPTERCFWKTLENQAGGKWICYMMIWFLNIRNLWILSLKILPNLCSLTLTLEKDERRCLRQGKSMFFKLISVCVTGRTQIQTIFCPTKKKFPLNSQVHVYYMRNLVCMFHTHLHLTHQSVSSEEIFDVQGDLRNLFFLTSLCS